MTEKESRERVCSCCGNTEWTLLDIVMALPSDFDKAALKITGLAVCNNCGTSKHSDCEMINVNDDLSEDFDERDG